MGGVQNHIRAIAKYLPKEKFEVGIATSKDAKRKGKNIDGRKIYEFNIAGNLVGGYKGEAKKYQDFLLQNKFDIIFFYSAQQWSFDLSLPIIEKIKAKKIFAPCGFSRLGNLYYLLYYFILKLKINDFNKIVLFSREYQDYKFCSKHYKKPLSIIPNAGVMCKVKINQKFEKKNTLKILNVGKFSLKKNQLYLLLITFFIKRKIILNYYFNNFGIYYQLLFLLSKVVTKIKGEQVTVNFHYNKSPNQISKSFIENDLFVFTSVVECSPLVIYDAAVNSLPFISSKVGNVSEIARKSKIGILYNDFFHLVNLINNFKKKKIRTKKYKFEWKIQLEKYKKEFLLISRNS